MAKPPLTAQQWQHIALIFAAFIAGLCSIIYELLIATTTAYFLGDSVKYFSLTIGLYMAAMGAGSFLSKYLRTDLLHRFVYAELLLGVLGGLSIPLLYFCYAMTPYFMPVYVILTLMVGLLIGLEIPFLTRLMEDYQALRVNIANILSLDYLGALLATLAFPFILLPWLGVYQSSLLVGLINMSIAVVILLRFGNQLQRQRKALWLATAVGTGVIAIMMITAGVALKHWDNALYSGRIVYTEQSPYQRIVMTQQRDDIRLFLDGNLQFSSIDEYRYHEALVVVPMSYAKGPISRVLLLGAGDGLAVRELLKYPDIDDIVLVDLDPAIVELARSNPHIVKLNQGSLDHEKVTLVTGDALSYLQDNQLLFDFIVIDLPDPNNTALARLYSQQFYRLAMHNLTPQGMLVTQATSPYFAPKAFWSIKATLEAASASSVYPYQVNVPSFGEWGFVMASRQPLATKAPVNLPQTQYLSPELMPTLFVFNKDVIAENVAVNQLDKPVLLQYYLDGWRYYHH